MSESTMNQTQYCAVADLVDRMLVKANDVANYTPEMTYCIVEASRMVDTFLMPYITVPIVGTPADQIVIATADFAASIFKRRYVPAEVKMKNLMPDMINDVDGSGWFALGLKKIIEYIKDYFALTNNPANYSGEVFNSSMVLDLYSKGLLTLKEARAYMANPNTADAITKILNTTKIDVESLTKLTTHRQYVTKKQNSFAFIAGANNDEFTNQGGYTQSD